MSQEKPEEPSPPSQEKPLDLDSEVDVISKQLLEAKTKLAQTQLDLKELEELRAFKAAEDEKYRKTQIQRGQATVTKFKQVLQDQEVPEGSYDAILELYKAGKGDKQSEMSKTLFDTLGNKLASLQSDNAKMTQNMTKIKANLASQFVPPIKSIQEVRKATKRPFESLTKGFVNKKSESVPKESPRVPPAPKEKEEQSFDYVRGVNADPDLFNLFQKTMKKY